MSQKQSLYHTVEADGKKYSVKPCNNCEDGALIFYDEEKGKFIDFLCRHEKKNYHFNYCDGYEKRIDRPEHIKQEQTTANKSTQTSLDISSEYQRNVTLQLGLINTTLTKIYENLDLNGIMLRSIKEILTQFKDNSEETTKILSTLSKQITSLLPEPLGPKTIVEGDSNDERFN